MIGKTWADLTHPQDRPAEESQFKRMLEGAVEGYQLEKRFCGKNGRTVHANLSVRCMRNEDRTVDCVLAWVQESDRH